MSKKSRESAGRETPGREARAQLMSAVESLSGSVGVRRACELLGVSRASWYRARQTRATARARPRPPLALRPHEQEKALAVLHAERFVDQAPRTIYATLLEEGRYLASVRTLYRLLASRSEVRERRAQRRHPNYSRPELLATAPNQLWSWDITRLKGPPAEGSREVDLFPPVCDPGCFQPLRRRLDGRSSGVVTVGRAAHPAHLQKSQHPLRATDSARRPRLLDEVQARRAAARRSRGHQDPFPEDARAHCEAFFHWYNHEHRHSGIALFTPADVHRSLVAPRLRTRQATLDKAFKAHIPTVSSATHRSPTGPPAPSGSTGQPPNPTRNTTTPLPPQCKPKWSHSH